MVKINVAIRLVIPGVGQDGFINIFSRLKIKRFFASITKIWLNHVNAFEKNESNCLLL